METPTRKLRSLLPELQSAQTCIDNNQPAEALLILQPVMNDAPCNAPAKLLAAIASWDAGNLHAAAGFASEVIALQPDNNLAQSYRAMALMATGCHEEGQAIFREFGFNDSPTFRMRLTAWAESQWLDYNRFFNQLSYDPVSPIRPGIAAKLFRGKIAERYFFGHRFSELLQLLEPYVWAGKASMEEVFATAMAAEMLQDYERAWSLINLIPASAEPPPDILRGLRARILLRLRRLEDAAAEANEILMLGPEDFGVNHVMGVLCLAFGKPIEGRQFFLRSHTEYMIDTLEYQQWQLEQALLRPANGGSPA